MTDYQNPWIYQGESFTSEMIGEYYGFVYLITNRSNGMKYIGRKYFISIKTVAKTASGRRKKSRNESDWKNYYGSSKLLKVDILKFGKENFSREILSLHRTKGEVNYAETKTQFKMDVLETVDEDGNRVYYNENIANRYFVPRNPNYEKSEEHKKKLSESLKAKGIRPPTCSEPKTAAHKKKLSEASKRNSVFNSHDTNPNSTAFKTYTVEMEDGVKEIRDFKLYMISLGYDANDYGRLLLWSKKQPLLKFNGKMKRVPLHRKYKMRILKIVNGNTGEVLDWGFTQDQQ